MKFVLKLACFLVVAGLLIGSSGVDAVAADDISPVVPSIASFILPGAGQLINNQPSKALTHFVVIVGIDTATYMLAGTTATYWASYRIGSALHLAWSGYSAYDAYQVASGHRPSIFNSALEVEPEDSAGTDLELSSRALTITEPSREFSVSAVD